MRDCFQLKLLLVLYSVWVHFPFHSLEQTITCSRFGEGVMQWSPQEALMNTEMHLRVGHQYSLRTSRALEYTSPTSSTLGNTHLHNYTPTHNGAHPHKHSHSPTHIRHTQSPNHTPTPTHTHPFSHQHQTHLKLAPTPNQVSCDRST